MTRVAACLLAAALLATSFAVVETAAGASKLSKKAALKKTAKLARTVARKQGAPYYFAFGCTRKSRTVVNCVGGIAWADNSGCIQRVRNKRKGGKIVARRVGRSLCGSVPQQAGGGGGGESTAICAIRQSVCI